MAEQNNGEAETRESLAEGHGITFPNAEEAIKWLQSGTRQKLLDKIADRLYLWDDKPFKDMSHYQLADEIMAMVEEAGYRLPMKIEQVTHKLLDKVYERWLKVEGATAGDLQLMTVLALMEAGYRPPAGRAPLLTKEEILKLIGLQNFVDLVPDMIIAKAQNDADNKWYGGIK